MKELILLTLVTFVTSPVLAMKSVEADSQDCIYEVFQIYDELAQDDFSIPYYRYKITADGPILFLESDDKRYTTYFDKAGSTVISRKGSSGRETKTIWAVIEDMVEKIGMKSKKDKDLKQDFQGAVKVCNQAKGLPKKLAGDIYALGDYTSQQKVEVTSETNEAAQ